MSTPFLMGFSEGIVRHLLQRDLLEIQPGGQQRVIQHVALVLSKAHHQSLISTLANALISADDTVEFYADNEQLKLLVQDLRTP